MVTPAFEGGFEAGALALNAAGVGLLAFFPAGILRGGVAGGERGAEGDVVIRHQLEDLGGAVVAVLDGLRSGEDGAAHAFGGAGVDGDGDAGALGGLDGEFHFVERKGGARAGAGAPAVVAVELDPIGAVADLVADDAGQAVDAVGLFGALRDAPFEGESFGRVTAGGDDGAGGGEDSRAGDDALVDGLLEFDVGVGGALGAEIADGGEARHESGAQVIDGAGGAQGESLVRDLIVPGSFVVGVEQDVGVAFDEAGEQGGAGEVDDLGVGGVDGGGGSGGLDAVAADADGPGVVGGLAIEDAGGFEDGGVLGEGGEGEEECSEGTHRRIIGCGGGVGLMGWTGVRRYCCAWSSAVILMHHAT